MKLTPEQVAKLTEAMRPFVATIQDAAPTWPHSAMRLRWDWAYGAKCSPLFTEFYKAGANDDHIDTALRRVVRDLGFPQFSV